MKRMYINSYYSEVDYSDNDYTSVDGLFSIEYSEDVDIKKEIEKTYREFVDADKIVCTLAWVLEDLKKNGKIESWEKVSCEVFDCDYGTFKE